MFKEYGKVFENADLTNYNTYKLKSKSRYLILVDDITKLKKIIKYLKDNNYKYFIIGNGSNIILPNFYDGVIIKLDIKKVKFQNNIVEVSADYMINKLAFETANNSMQGLEWASGLPGTIGGCIKNNAGCYGNETFNNLIKIDVIAENEIITLNKKDIKHGYRFTNLDDVVILKAYFKLKKGNKQKLLKEIQKQNNQRNQSQILTYPSSGSVFKNPKEDYAGRLIEDVGLKGKKVGGAMISDKHANFIINVNNAVSEDIIKLIVLAKEKVYKKHKIKLKLEQEIIES